MLRFESNQTRCTKCTAHGSADSLRSVKLYYECLLISLLSFVKVSRRFKLGNVGRSEIVIMVFHQIMVVLKHTYLTFLLQIRTKYYYHVRSWQKVFVLFTNCGKWLNWIYGIRAPTQPGTTIRSVPNRTASTMRETNRKILEHPHWDSLMSGQEIPRLAI